MKTGIELIAIERQEQIEKHGYSSHTDNQYNDNGELLIVANYLLKIEPSENDWPSNWSNVYKSKIDRKDRLDKLKIAGALIAAEIDRINTN